MRSICLSLCFLSCWLLLGCGSADPRATVKGKVTVAGKGPLTGGIIQFVDADNPKRISGGEIEPDGTYHVPDAPVGNCKVIVDNSFLAPGANKGMGTPGGMMGGPGSMNMKGMPGGGAAAANKGANPKDTAKMGTAPKGVTVSGEMDDGRQDLAARKYVKIDPNFSKADSTTLTAKVVKGENTADFDVK